MDITELAGIGPGRAKLLGDMGIHNVGDLRRYFPRDYDDRSQIKTIAMLSPGATHSIRGTISAEGENIVFRAGTLMTKLQLQDEGGRLELVWFGRPYLKSYFKKHETYLFTGRVVENYGRLQMESPDYEKITAEGEALSAGRIVPLYSLPKGISQKMFRKWMRAALDANIKEVETLPLSLLSHLCPIEEAIQNIHFPESEEQLHTARRRLVFDELFFMQLALMRIKGAVQPGARIADVKLSPFIAGLPFNLTEAQQSVLQDIRLDMQSGKRMNRLIQGDVGSGKTVIAAAAAYLVIAGGYQAAIMAPTEVLARQHFKQFTKYLPAYQVALLVGSLSAKEKKALHAAIFEGRVQMLVGTHALIQDTVKFRNLALVITDEQHRFGVSQRAALSGKLNPLGGSAFLPHTAIMTATPIPRTLGLILYGDMDISTIDTRPPGRQEIKTYQVNSSYRARLWAFMAKQVAEGRQVYVICPAIEESEADINSVLAYAEQLQKALPHLSIACLHGRLKDKEGIMAAFARNEYSIIVSTTVIEVGVDVANASLIVIENAERFGLSQLHQLRGRVGRGPYQSYCVLVTDSRAEHSIERMKAMLCSGDGFVLSELDLKLRGPGDFFGVQQHGLPAFRLTNLYRDMDILKDAQAAAIRLYEGGMEISEEEEQIINRTLIGVL